MNKEDTRALLPHYIMSRVYHTGYQFKLFLTYEFYTLKSAFIGMSWTVENHTSSVSGAAMEDLCKRDRMAVWSFCLNTASLSRDLVCVFL